MLNNTHVILFQTFFARIWKIYYWNFERFIRNARSIFELEKMFFFLNGSEFCQIGTIIRHQTMTKTRSRWSVTSEPSVPPIPNGDIKLARCHWPRHNSVPVCVYICWHQQQLTIPYYLDYRPGPWRAKHPRRAQVRSSEALHAPPTHCGGVTLYLATQA